MDEVDGVELLDPLFGLLFAYEVLSLVVIVFTQELDKLESSSVGSDARVFILFLFGVVRLIYILPDN